MRDKVVILLAPLLVLAFLIGNVSLSAVKPGSTEFKQPAVYETRMTLRDLWVEHVFWVRNYVLASHQGSTSATAAAEQQVVNNAHALAASIEPFYGKAAADALFDLLAGHWGAIRQYNNAVLDGNVNARDRAIRDLTGNARKIAVFLNSANPYLGEESVFNLLSVYGSHHISQIDAWSSGDFEYEAENWRAMREHMLDIADALSAALAKQQPSKFI